MNLHVHTFTVGCRARRNDVCILYARHILKIILCLAREQMQECRPCDLMRLTFKHNSFVVVFFCFVLASSRSLRFSSPCCRRTMATLMLMHTAHCKCDEGNFIRLNEDFIDLIIANKRLMCLAQLNSSLELNGTHYFTHAHTVTMYCLSLFHHTHTHTSDNGNEYSSRLIYDFDKLSRIQMDFQLKLLYIQAQLKLKCTSTSLVEIKYNRKTKKK